VKGVVVAYVEPHPPIARAGIIPPRSAKAGASMKSTKFDRDIIPEIVADRGERCLLFVGVGAAPYARSRSL
jgi:hypothetical protein